MVIKLLESYHFGDMSARYYIDEESKNIGLVLLPISKLRDDTDYNCFQDEIDSLVQFKIVGDIYPGAYAGGNTMRQGPSTTNLEYEASRHVIEDSQQTIITTLIDKRGYIIEHHLSWKQNTEYLEVFVILRNESREPIVIEMLSSFSIGGITPLSKGDAHGQLKLHRIRSVWSMEGRLETRSMEELQLEPAWSRHAIRCERFGQIGSMAVNKYFPFIVVEDEKNQVFWGAQLAHNASWQIEAYRKNNDLGISGGLADREFCGWTKIVPSLGEFVTPHAILSVCTGDDINNISYRLTSSVNDAVNKGPDIEQDLPIIFNEYCTTWGNPSDENIKKIIEKIKNKGFTYFVIDCGWYKEKGVPWDISMGDYNVSSDLFPDGLDKTVKLIKDAGMKPGIWFEIENVGFASAAYSMENHLLKRDGKVLTTTTRRFWDMRDSWVIDYLSDKVIGMIRQYGFEYMKIDYNDTIGLGCEGKDEKGIECSLAEGLRLNAEAAKDFIQKVKSEVPGIVLENCASGGHRLEPLMMRLCSMASFSDAHECIEIPIIAGNLHRVILPRQSQIWAVIRKYDSLKRVAYSIAATFLGRMCLSGDVLELDQEQWSIIDKGIRFYKRIASIIKCGKTYHFGTPMLSYRYTVGWQGILRMGEDNTAVAIFHVFEECADTELIITCSELKGMKIKEIYSENTTEDIKIRDKQLIFKSRENFKAVAVYMKHSDRQ